MSDDRFPDLRPVFVRFLHPVGLDHHPPRGVGPPDAGDRVGIEHRLEERSDGFGVAVIGERVNEREHGSFKGEGLSFGPDIGVRPA